MTFLVKNQQMICSLVIGRRNLLTLGNVSHRLLMSV